MVEKDAYSKERGQLSRYLAIGGITGGIIGIVIALLYRVGILIIPVLVSIFDIVSIDPIITGTVLGIATGAVIGTVASMGSNRKYASNTDDGIIPGKTLQGTDSSVKMQLREEQLDIYKKKIQTGEVNIHKEVLTEEKSFTVPVTREELVIEKTVMDSSSHSKAEAHTETIRIPISEERVDISKHPVTLEDVSVYRHQFEEIEHITETLKKEIAHINTTGTAKVIDEEAARKDISN